MKSLRPEDKAKWKTIMADHDPKTASTTSAILSVAQHFVENEILIENDAQREVEKNPPKWTPSNDDEIGEFMFERDQARQLHDETLIPMHRYSCVIVLYIALERELRRLTDNLQLERKQKLKVKDLRAESFLEQTNKFLAAFYDLDISQCPHYAMMRDLQKIRDCIVHCQGEVALSKDKDYLVKMNKKPPGLFIHPRSDIKLERGCIKLFIQETMEFFIWVFQRLQQVQPVEKLNWKINPSTELQRLRRVFDRLD